MIKEFKVPALGDSVAEVEISTWLVELGATVAVDDEVVEVETDKSLVAVPSPWKGTLHARHGEPGDVLEVGQPLFSIDVPEAR
jgi:pyruvate/2-oxoglutarate dehydrogenase complex dihydrolipoamide acyltransferase (E2) component